MASRFVLSILFVSGVWGCGAGTTASDLAPPDTTAPRVTVTEPGPVTVSGLVTLTARAEDDRGVSGVRFRVDEQDVAPEDTTVPFEETWNSRSVRDGQHFIDAVARDQAGNMEFSAPVRIKTHNGPN
jgi:hypothetical protein